MSFPEFVSQFAATWQTAPFFNRFMIVALVSFPVIFVVFVGVMEKLLDIEV